MFWLLVIFLTFKDYGALFITVNKKYISLDDYRPRAHLFLQSQGYPADQILNKEILIRSALALKIMELMS